MKLTINKNGLNALTRIRRRGYSPHKNRQEKNSFVRRLSGNEFPRFHLYVNKDDDDLLHCSIHLDQTAPVYNKGNAHRGDYNSTAVKIEVERIKNS